MEAMFIIGLIGIAAVLLYFFTSNASIRSRPSPPGPMGDQPTQVNAAVAVAEARWTEYWTVRLMKISHDWKPTFENLVNYERECRIARGIPVGDRTDLIQAAVQRWDDENNTPMAYRSLGMPHVPAGREREQSILRCPQ